MVVKTWNDIQKEMKGGMLNTFLLVELKSLLIEFYLNMYKIAKISCCSSSSKKLFYIHCHCFKLVIENWRLICHCQ